MPIEYVNKLMVEASDEGILLKPTNQSPYGREK